MRMLVEGAISSRRVDGFDQLVALRARDHQIATVGVGQGSAQERQAQVWRRQVAAGEEQHATKVVATGVPLLSEPPAEVVVVEEVSREEVAGRCAQLGHEGAVEKRPIEPGAVVVQHDLHHGVLGLLDDLRTQGGAEDAGLVRRRAGWCLHLHRPTHRLDSQQLHGSKGTGSARSHFAAVPSIEPRSEQDAEHGDQNEGQGEREQQRTEATEPVGEEEEHAVDLPAAGGRYARPKRSSRRRRSVIDVTGSIEYLPAVDIAGHQPSVGAGADHPMRIITRRAAGLEDPPWDAQARDDVAALFDELASDWHTRTSPERARVVSDAFERGDAGRNGRTALEVGSGIGAYTGMLADRFERVIAVDLSMEMLRLAAAGDGLRVRADSAHLPVGDGAVDAVVLVNMLLFPDEVDRVLAPAGCVVWINSSGEQTPIHLPPEEVADALPGEWTGVAARAGIGLWAVLRRR